jgi:DHA1 family bicyclomycin/chloramphenicol resistance-like MFS transporter
MGRKLSLPQMIASSKAEISMPKYIILLLGCLASLAPLAIETSLPAVPAIASDLGTSLSMTQWSFTGMFAGMATGQLFAAPFCDRLGRRPVLLWGLAVFVLASLGCALAPTVELLIFSRFIQGFAASIGVLVSKAVPRDLWDGPYLTAKLSFITSISTAAMICGAMIGSLLLVFMSWRDLLLLFPLLGSFLFVMTFLYFKETLPPHKRFYISFLKRYIFVIKNRRAMIYFIANSCFYGSMVAFITGSPGVFLVKFEMDILTYGLMYGFAIGCLTLGSLLNGLLATRLQFPARILIGIGLAVIALLVLGLTVSSPNVVTALIGGAIFAASCGFNYPNSQAAGLSEFPQHAGVAAGVIGSLERTPT